VTVWGHGTPQSRLPRTAQHLSAPPATWRSTEPESEEQRMCIGVVVLLWVLHLSVFVCMDVLAVIMCVVMVVIVALLCLLFCFFTMEFFCM